MDVSLPDGTRIRASSIHDRVTHDATRDFGLYLDARWEPSWPSETIDWPDFGTPFDRVQAAARIRDTFLRARQGETVEVGCLGGLGRTGTVLACMTVLTGLDAQSAIGWVRQHYRLGAVETAEQERWVAWFHDWAMSESGRTVLVTDDEAWPTSTP